MCKVVKPSDLAIQSIYNLRSLILMINQEANQSDSRTISRRDLKERYHLCHPTQKGRDAIYNIKSTWQRAIKLLIFDRVMLSILLIRSKMNN